MRGYKGTTALMTCRGYPYEIGKTYKTEESISLCHSGFHFCKSLKDCFSYYDEEQSRFFEVESPDDCTIVGDNKCVTSEITFIRELSRVEINRIKYGYVYGYGYGYGDGYGNGNGNGDGYGNGYGDGYGNGYGDGYGNGYVYGYGNGYGDGYGNGYGDGYGNGYGNKNILSILNYKEI